MDRDDTFERFKHDTENHSLEVLHDDGVYRHLKFSRGGSQVYRFDLVTWPGHLTICGDMGTTTFSRLPDMFEFFRFEDQNGNSLSINPGYWGEKVQAGEIKTFSNYMFAKSVREHIENCEEDEHVHAETKKEIEDRLTSGFENSHEAATWLYDYDPPDDSNFEFTDWFDWVQMNDYTYHYIWQLFAIVWGIQQYDTFKAAEESGRNR